MNILFIGNFGVSFSTEQDRAWSLNQLGHNVLAYQENKTTVPLLEKAIAEQANEQKIDLILYSHTHGWEIPGLKEFFNTCKKANKKAKIRTASVHLDRWAWLERAVDIGVEATWFTEYQFMADASPEAVELYRKRNLKWFFLKPGVLGKECVLEKADKTLEEIVFIGSDNYHPEYSFRPKLVDFLKRTYGQRFAHYGGSGRPTVRGLELNRIMASAKIVIGDSCFGGRPFYVSDRYYETRGRGGFLLHPHTQGHDTQGVADYNPMDLQSLEREITFYLGHEKDRERMRLEGFNHVKENETYTNRSQEMLDIMFGDTHAN